MNYELHNKDYLEGVRSIPDETIDLVIADPPYGLGKDYGNDSDLMNAEETVEWTMKWVELTIPKVKDSGSLYIFTTWRHSPEIFSLIKKKMTMLNEIIWDRRVPSMGGSTRKFSSVHDTIGFFAKSKDYYFDLDAVRVPYDPETKRARTRNLFKRSKWLEVGYNPKDVWSVSRLHKQHAEREDHPTQKPFDIIERMVKVSCPPQGVVLDPFAGSGTAISACIANNRRCLAYELNPRYCEIIENRIKKTTGKLFSSEDSVQYNAG